RYRYQILSLVLGSVSQSGGTHRDRPLCLGNSVRPLLELIPDTRVGRRSEAGWHGHGNSRTRRKDRTRRGRSRGSVDGHRGALGGRDVGGDRKLGIRREGGGEAQGRSEVEIQIRAGAGKPVAVSHKVVARIWNRLEMDVAGGIIRPIPLGRRR